MFLAKLMIRSMRCSAGRGAMTYSRGDHVESTFFADESPARLPAAALRRKSGLVGAGCRCRRAVRTSRCTRIEGCRRRLFARLIRHIRGTLGFLPEHHELCADRRVDSWQRRSGNGRAPSIVCRRNGRHAADALPKRRVRALGSPDPADSNNCFDGRRLVEPLHSGCASLRSWQKGQSRPRQLV